MCVQGGRTVIVTPEESYDMLRGADSALPSCSLHPIATVSSRGMCTSCELLAVSGSGACLATEELEPCEDVSDDDTIDTETAEDGAVEATA